MHKKMRSVDQHHHGTKSDLIVGCISGFLFILASCYLLYLWYIHPVINLNNNSNRSTSLTQQTLTRSESSGNNTDNRNNEGSQRYVKINKLFSWTSSFIPVRIKRETVSSLTSDLVIQPIISVPSHQQQLDQRSPQENLENRDQASPYPLFPSSFLPFDSVNSRFSNRLKPSSSFNHSPVIEEVDHESLSSPASSCYSSNRSSLTTTRSAVAVPITVDNKTITNGISISRQSILEKSHFENKKLIFSKFDNLSTVYCLTNETISLVQSDTNEIVHDDDGTNSEQLADIELPEETTDGSLKENLLSQDCHPPLPQQQQQQHHRYRFFVSSSSLSNHINKDTSKYSMYSYEMVMKREEDEEDIEVGYSFKETDDEDVDEGENEEEDENRSILLD
jgi:hypothetical protein